MDVTARQTAIAGSVLAKYVKSGMLDSAVYDDEAEIWTITIAGIEKVYNWDQAVAFLDGASIAMMFSALETGLIK